VRSGNKEIPVVKLVNLTGQIQLGLDFRVRIRIRVMVMVKVRVRNMVRVTLWISCVTGFGYGLVGAGPGTVIFIALVRTVRKL
jgi:hypothetical protein